MLLILFIHPYTSYKDYIIHVVQYLRILYMYIVQLLITLRFRLSSTSFKFVKILTFTYEVLYVLNVFKTIRVKEIVHRIGQLLESVRILYIHRREKIFLIIHEQKSLRNKWYTA